MSKTYIHDDLGEIVVTKRATSKNMRISVKANGKVAVSIPKWVAYKYAVEFIQEKALWVKEQQDKRRIVQLEDGLRLGKTHRISLLKTDSTSTTTRVVGNELRIFIPQDMDVQSPDVIRIADNGIRNVLKKQAAELLPQRLAQIAETTGYTYANVSIGSMKTRWGSCSSEQEIRLNCYLMQLPWDLIDYVLLHELVHTKVMSHGQPFWLEIAAHLPNYKEIKKNLKDFSPHMNLA